MATTENKISHYELIDSKTGRLIRVYAVAQRNIGRRRADKLDREYGAIRYSCRPIFTK